MPNFGFRHRKASLLALTAAVALTPSAAFAAPNAASPTPDKGSTAKDEHKPFGTGVGRKVG